MNKPTGKLAFAYATITRLEARIAELEAAQQPEASGAGERSDALQIADLIDPHVRKQAPDHLTMAAAAMALRALASKTDAEAMATIRVALASKPPAGEQKRCGYCDDTGDVHSIDGEWRGRCTCPAGEQKPVGVVTYCNRADERTDVEWSGERPDAGTQLYTTPQPEQVAQDDGMCGHCAGTGTVTVSTGHLGPDDYEYEADCDACGGTGSSDIRDAINALPYQPHSVTPGRQMVYRGDVLRIIAARTRGDGGAKG